MLGMDAERRRRAEWSIFVGLQWMSVFLMAFGVFYTGFIGWVSFRDEHSEEQELHRAS